jgi:hypothetical protein
MFCKLAQGKQLFKPQQAAQQLFNQLAQLRRNQNFAHVIVPQLALKQELTFGMCLEILPNAYYWNY